ncbi:MAG: hypothetical protein LBE24_04160 [Methylobacillus sp.]|jgi:hypothetical protein|nr:hypothetical protein [Methylobacillus sp.]
MSQKALLNDQTSRKVIRLAQSTEASLGLLRDIDETIEALSNLEKVLDGLSGMTEAAIKEIKATPIIEGIYLDPDDIGINSLEQTENVSKTALAALVTKRGYIDTDPELQDHHREDLHDAYESVITQVAEFIEAVGDFRRAIIAHDLKSEPRSGDEYSNVDDLVAALKG